LQNSDETKFCRGCGTDLSSVLAVVEKGGTRSLELAEEHIDLFSNALRNLIIGIGFLVVAFAGFAMTDRLAVLTLFSLLAAPYFIGTGVSRLVKAKALKRLREVEASRSVAALTPGEPHYIKPERSMYETDDLAATPRSITEHTTTHLKRED
jgi:hypothetical protein